jgi:hypothetical protein
VGHGASAALFHWQAGLGTVEGLDMALFIDTEDQRHVRGIEVSRRFVNRLSVTEH